jgi:hypothetical protein
MNKKLLINIMIFFFAGVFIFEANAQSTLALQEKCAEGAKKFIADPEKMAVYSGYSGYISHYSKRFDKCFIRIGYYYGVEKEKVQNGTIPLRLPDWEIKLYDVFGLSMVGNYHRAKGATIFCWVGDTEYKSLDEFEVLIKSYMVE